jgi:hypothetical protein
VACRLEDVKAALVDPTLYRDYSPRHERMDTTLVATLRTTSIPSCDDNWKRQKMNLRDRNRSCVTCHLLALFHTQRRRCGFADALGTGRLRTGGSFHAVEEAGALIRGSGWPRAKASRSSTIRNGDLVFDREECPFRCFKGCLQPC